MTQEGYGQKKRTTEVVL